MYGADNVIPRVPGTLLHHLLSADPHRVLCGGLVVVDVTILKFQRKNEIDKKFPNCSHNLDIVLLALLLHMGVVHSDQAGVAHLLVTEI